MIKKLILGTAQFGMSYGINNPQGQPSEALVTDILKTAYKQGIDTLDTADAYGNAIDILGRYHLLNLRFNVINKFTLDGNISAKITASLKKMNIQSFEACLFHSFSNFENCSKKTAHELAGLKQNGLIKKIGVSVYSNRELEKASESTITDIIQMPFNLLDNLYQRERFMKKAKENGKEIHVRSVFLQGLFLADEKTLSSKLQPLLRYIHQLKEIAKGYDTNLTKMALSYAAACSYVDRILIGVDTKEQLMENIFNLLHPVESTAMEKINHIKVEEVPLLYPFNWN